MANMHDAHQAREYCRDAAKVRHDKIVKFTLATAAILVAVLAGILTSSKNEIAVSFLKDLDRDFLFIAFSVLLFVLLAVSYFMLKKHEDIIEGKREEHVEFIGGKGVPGLRDFLELRFGVFAANFAGKTPQELYFNLAGGIVVLLFIGALLLSGSSPLVLGALISIAAILAGIVLVVVADYLFYKSGRA